jgi:hypothetical protein
MINLIGPINSGAAVGETGTGDATATGYSSIAVSGLIHTVQVKYNGTPPATCDVVIATKGNSAPVQTILTLTDKNADGTFPVRVVGCSNLGVADASAVQKIAIDDIISVKIDQVNDGDSVDVWLLMEN